MQANKRIYEDRTYEGEWYFACHSPCPGYLVEYSFYEYDKLADNFLSNRTGGHAVENCHLCNGWLEWAGFSGDMPISQSIVSLIENGHFMASTVVLASITENTLSNLLWASLVDNGIERKKANNIANGRMSRGEVIELTRTLTQWNVKDLAFPIRNLVAHGKGFGQQEKYYFDELKKQVAGIRKWVNNIPPLGFTPKNFIPTECERWLLFMYHWSNWLESYVEGHSIKQVSYSKKMHSEP